MTAPDHAIKPLENILRERGHPYMHTDNGNVVVGVERSLA